MTSATSASMPDRSPSGGSLGRGKLAGVAAGLAWARYRLEDRQVTVDGFVSVDGVLYGLPASAALTGRTVQVSVQHQTVTIWAQGQVVAQHAVRTVSGTRVEHAEQFTGVAPASTRPPHPHRSGISARTRTRAPRVRRV